MNTQLKRIVACSLCLILLLAVFWGYYMIRRGPETALLRDYGVRFKDWPFVVSRKVHLDLGEPREYEEWNETAYQVEADLFGIRSTLSFDFLSGNKLERVYIEMPMDDPQEIKDKFQDLSALIESEYKDEAGLSKDDIAYTNENEYEIHMSFRVSGATSVSYWIKATHRGLTISCSYSW